MVNLVVDAMLFGLSVGFALVEMFRQQSINVTMENKRTFMLFFEVWVATVGRLFPLFGLVISFFTVMKKIKSFNQNYSKEKEIHMKQALLISLVVETLSLFVSMSLFK